MNWTIKFTEKAFKVLEKMERIERNRIMNFLEITLPSYENPRAIGAALQGALSGSWKYRVVDYRILCRIFDNELVVSILEIGHRKEIYKH